MLRAARISGSMPRLLNHESILVVSANGSKRGLRGMEVVHSKGPRRLAGPDAKEPWNPQWWQTQELSRRSTSRLGTSGRLRRFAHSGQLASVTGSVNSAGKTMRNFKNLAASSGFALSSTLSFSSQSRGFLACGLGAARAPAETSPEGERATPVAGVDFLDGEEGSKDMG